MRAEASKTIRLAFPIIIGELAQMTLHIIDTAMVGAISYKQLAAASLVITSLVINAIGIPFILGIGITISVSQMVSMAHGQRDAWKVSHYLFNGFFLCALTAVIISAGLELGKDLLWHMGQDPEVVELAIPFMQLMGFSIIPMMLFMTLKQFADGLEFTKTAMMLSLLSMPVNIFLNWLLIYGNWGFPRLELLGAGWATLITRTLIFILLALIILNHRTFRRYIIVSRTAWKLRRKTLRELLNIGIPSSLQLSAEAGAFTISAILMGTISAIAQHQRDSAGRPPDCHQLRLFYLHGIYGTLPGRVHPGQQRFWPERLEKNIRYRQKRFNYRIDLWRFLCDRLCHIPKSAAQAF